MWNKPPKAQMGRWEQYVQESQEKILKKKKTPCYIQKKKNQNSEYIKWKKQLRSERERERDRTKLKNEKASKDRYFDKIPLYRSRSSNFQSDRIMKLISKSSKFSLFFID